MTRRKPLSVVEAGRKGGSAGTEAQRRQRKAAAAQPRGKRREQWYADGWRDAMERAARLVRAACADLDDVPARSALDKLANRIEDEPAPKKDGK